MTPAEHKAHIQKILREQFNQYLAANNLEGKLASFDMHVDNAPTPQFVSVKRQALLKAIEAARPAVSTEETRYYLCGVLFEVAKQGRQLNIVSTNGHILVATELDVLATNTHNMGCIVSDMKTKGVRRTQTPVANLLKDLKASKVDTVTIKILPTRIDIDGVTYAGIEGTYPDWRRVLPYHPDPVRLTIDTAELRKMLSEVHKEDREKWGRAVTITHHDAYRAEHIVRLVCDRKSVSVKFGLNSRYLDDLTKNAPATVDIVTDAANTGGPALVDHGDGVTRVIMPLRV